MKTLRMLSLTLTFVVLTAAAASAQEATPRINHRQVRQETRIHQGVRSGELTRGEAMRLQGGERHIQNMKMRAKSDGVVTPNERARIGRAQNRESQHIYRLKHNDITR
jgi:hypothetical protein